ncbi:MAG: MobH family relaxase [Pseudomonadota bacterium]|nr:MobH family relaxase [Pseudomonadota bacterium]
MGLLLFRRRDVEPVLPPGSSAPLRPRPDLTPVLDAATLLAAHQPTLQRIRQQVGVPLAHWNALYAPLLQQYATFVQQLPASEAHHHRQPGGLLAHGLETALKALTLRRGALLPAGADAETLADKQDVWTYAVASAALLHDLGKPVVDQIVALYDAAGDPLGHWRPLAGPIQPPAAHYSMYFVRGRRYRLHTRLPPLLVQHLLPQVAVNWIAEDLDVFEAWLATISGGDAGLSGELGRMVHEADRLSTAASLTGDPALRTAGVRQPLAERLIVALRHLIDSGALPLNRPGAAAFVTGEDLWLVSKRVLDALREALLTEAPGGIPSRNERLMDELQQHGVITPNGERAIWYASVELPDWQHRLSLLRVPLARLWIDPESQPPAMTGRVIPDGESPQEDASPGSTATNGSAPPTFISPSPQQPSLDLSGTGEDDDDATGRLPGAGVADSAPSETPPLHDDEVIRWICDGLRSGRLKLNSADARLHVTLEGLLLVSPGIFRDVAGVDGWLGAQKRLLKRKAHLKRPDGTNIWTYRVIGERKTGARLKGILIPDAQAQLGLQLPPPNPHLTLLSAEEASP